MSILFTSLSTCCVCGKTIEKTMLNLDESVSFPPFIQNVSDPLYKFNDDNAHVECLENDLGRLALEARKNFELATRLSLRRCVVSGKPIVDWEDFIFIDMLTSDKNDPRYKFNFTVIGRNNLSKWKNLEEFSKLGLNALYQF